VSSLDAAARGRFYGFFSRLWVKELDAELVAALKGPLGRELLPAFWSSDEPKLLEDEAKRQGAFDADFVHLTVVNLVPYESFFRREDGMLESGAVNPVVQFLGKYGLSVDLGKARSLAPDHLGIELEVESVLCEQERQAEGEGRADHVVSARAVQRDFLGEHLLFWAPIYLLAAQRNARTALYREAAEATLDFLLADFEALA
jgi:putative dimethyl sulfoxide reductase chaperone